MSNNNNNNASPITIDRTDKGVTDKVLRSIRAADKAEVSYAAYVATYKVTTGSITAHARALVDAALPELAGTAVTETRQDENGLPVLLPSGKPVKDRTRYGRALDRTSRALRVAINAPKKTATPSTALLTPAGGKADFIEVVSAWLDANPDVDPIAELAEILDMFKSA